MYAGEAEGKEGGAQRPPRLHRSASFSAYETLHRVWTAKDVIHSAGYAAWPACSTVSYLISQCANSVFLVRIDYCFVRYIQSASCSCYSSERKQDSSQIQAESSDAAITWAAGQGRQGPLRPPARALSLRRGLQQQSLWRRRYPTEPHIVTTSDGYIMQMDRIPRRGARSPPLPLFSCFNTPPSFASALHAHPHPACVTLLHR